MKKIYIVLAVAATAMLLTSCEEELSFNDVTLGKDEIAFSFSNVTTKAATNLPTAVKGISVPVGVDARGDAIFLEETIEELNPSPATKGAPAYTINLGNLYPKLGVYADGGNFGGDVVFGIMDKSTYDRKDGGSEGWRYQYSYPSNPWPANADEDVDFYLRLPAESAAEDFDYTTQGAIGFHYSSAENGEDQQDLLFGFTSISKNDHDAYRPNGAPVEMLHALTGVKFRSDCMNDNETKTIITKVEFTGLKGTGDCVITPASSSVVWSELGTGSGSFSMEFTNPEYSTAAGVDGTVNFEKGTDPKFGDSWYSAAADRNLNNEDGELTFWFIPQEITDDVKLKITFCVKTPDTAESYGGGFVEHEINFGELLNKDRSTPVKWEAGQLRTYTLNPRLVDVEIFDSMVGYKKSGLHVTNTGNVNEFVRMMVIGNWYGWTPDQDPSKDEPMILVGYTHAEPSNTEMVTPWFREDEHYGSFFDDTFKGGKPVAAAGNEWKFGTGSYFYYPNAIGPDHELAESSALFEYYELPANEVPHIYIPTASSSTRVEAVGVHLKLEVVIQAIAAQKPNSSEEYATWQEAWTAAVGKEIKEK